MKVKGIWSAAATCPAPWFTLLLLFLFFLFSPFPFLLGKGGHRWVSGGRGGLLNADSG